MSDNVMLVSPDRIDRNPENPRLIFHLEELVALQNSIADQGILVPLTVFKEGSRYCLLDGERRWRCAKKLGLSVVPIIVQPKPDRMQNIMMMFAIHNARRDWDPLPTAEKLVQLEAEFEKRNGRSPKERELAGIASLSTGEVRRLKKLLNIPKPFRQELMKELKKPRSQQALSPDQVLEAVKGAEALRKREVISQSEEIKLQRVLIRKFRDRIIVNTVAPRLLAKIARAVERKDVPLSKAQKAIQKLITLPKYTVTDAFEETVAQADFEHNTQKITERLIARLQEHDTRHYRPTAALRAALESLRDYLNRHLR